ncbi:unnamed protein product [Vicia faba]|uniref:Uncharacterized protein n=1 Tax=Vicia faba TaxID=3906 RepID=A0AAV0ZR43_VICFA|nr:unnamed protein product [Vicia faba]
MENLVCKNVELHTEVSDLNKAYNNLMARLEQQVASPGVTTEEGLVVSVPPSVSEMWGNPRQFEFGNSSGIVPTFILGTNVPAATTVPNNIAHRFENPFAYRKAVSSVGDQSGLNTFGSCSGFSHGGGNSIFDGPGHFSTQVIALMGNPINTSIVPVMIVHNQEEEQAYRYKRAGEDWNAHNTANLVVKTKMEDLERKLNVLSSKDLLRKHAYEMCLVQNVKHATGLRDASNS